MEMHFIQIPKFRKEKRGVETKLEQWMQFISQTNERGVELAMKENKEIRKANEEYEYLTGDAAERRLAFLRDKAIRDEKSIRQGGREEGREEGRKEGRIETLKQFVNNMIKRNMSTDEIQEITGISKEELEQIQKSLHSI